MPMPKHTQTQNMRFNHDVTSTRVRTQTWGALELARRTRGAGAPVASRVPGVARAGGAVFRGDRVARTVGARTAACLRVFTYKGV